MTVFDELWPGGPRLVRSAGFQLGTDSVLLAHFAAAGAPRRIADLGCGSGVLLVLLARAFPAAELTGIEIQPGPAADCRLNLAENGLAGRAGVICGDLREHRAHFAAGSFDLVVSNPPYFPVRGGRSAPDEGRRIAREEICCRLEDVIAAAAWLCRWGGAFAMVHRPERLSEIFVLASAAGLEPKRLRCVQYQAHSAPSLVLCEFRRGAKPGLRVEPPLILAGADGGDSPEVRQIYHRER